MKDLGLRANFPDSNLLKSRISVWMDGWMNRWMDWMDGWMTKERIRENERQRDKPSPKYDSTEVILILPMYHTNRQIHTYTHTFIHTHRQIHTVNDA